jgi:hypothetical protein
VKSITLPSTLKVIHEFAFGSCEYLTEIDFSQVVSLAYVGPYAFNYTAITHLVIESPINEMSPHALEDMPHLLSYEVNLVNPTIIILGDAYNLID